MIVKYKTQRVTIDGKIYFSAKNAFFAYMVGYAIAPVCVSYELRRVSASEYIKPKNKRDGYLISALGIKQWIMNSPIRFTPSEKQQYISSMVDAGLLSESERFSYSSTKESVFYSNVYAFFETLNLNVKIKKQVSVDDYIVDLIICDKIVVEFDELNHAGYSKDKENRRELIILSNGYSLLRFNDSESIGLILGKITSQLFEQKLI